MTHSVGDACPFDGLEHPRGETCCSFDATSTQAVLREAGEKPLAELVEVGFIDAERAYTLGLTLRDAYTSMVLFHAWSPPPCQFVKAYDDARSAGDDCSDWPPESIPDALLPMLRAADWFACLGRSAYGAHVVTR